MKKIYLFLAVLCCAVTIQAASYEVSTYSQLVNAVYNGYAQDAEMNSHELTASDTIRFTNDIVFGDEGDAILLPSNVTRIIDMNNYQLRRNSTNSPSAIRATMTLGANSTLTLINGSVICNNTLEDNSLLISAITLAAKGCTLNLEQTTLIGWVNKTNANNAYGLMLAENEGLTVNVRGANINCIYDNNTSYDHVFNLYDCHLGSAERLQASSSFIGWKVKKDSKIKGRFINSEIYGTNMSASAFLSLVGTDGYKFFNAANSYSPMTRNEVQSANMATAQIRVTPDLNFTVANKAVTTLNHNDILSDGRMAFDFLTNTLYLKDTPNEIEILNGNIYFQQQFEKLTINVAGRWRINGQIEAYCDEVEIQAASYGLIEEDADLLSVIYSAEIPVEMHDADLTLTNHVRLYVEADRDHDNAVHCHTFTVNDSWFDGWGVKPVVDCSYNKLINARIRNNNQLSNGTIAQVEPIIKDVWIQVQTNGDERGTVTGKGLYKAGTLVPITATPKEGYYFDRWAEDNNTEASRTVTAREDTYYTALFFPEDKYYAVTALSSDESLGTVTGGGEKIKENTQITLTATPKDGAEFKYWTNLQGARISNYYQLTVTVNAPQTYTAHFRAIPDYTSYYVTLNGTEVTSNNQNDILGDGVWSYDESTHSLITMEKKTYDITNTNFIVNNSAQTLNIELNHNITINASTTDYYNDAVLSSSYGFNIKGTPMNRLTINCTDMRAIYAAFGPVTISDALQVVITQTVTSWGKENIKPYLMQLKNEEGGLTVNGAEVYLKVKGDATFKVTNLTNDKLTLTNASISDGAMDGTNLSISNDAVRYQLHFANGALSTICPVYGFGFYYPGQVVTITADPKDGYEFVQWSDGNTDNPRVITMPDHDLLLDPMIEKDGVAPTGAIINISAPEEQGYIDNFTSGYYYADTQLTITAVANTGYEFVEWSDGNTDNPRTIIVEANKNINLVAVFAKQESQTGLENLQMSDEDSQKTHKLLIDGILYIIRDNKMYNAQGQQIR